MTNLRKSAVAMLAAVAVLSASALATPSAAHAGEKTDLAKAVIGGIIVGAIVGATQNDRGGPVIVQQPRRQHFGGNGFGQHRRHDGFGGQRVADRFAGQDCFTQEELTIDRFGNRASSIRTICR